jgi:hypothetical protein
MQTRFLSRSLLSLLSAFLLALPIADASAATVAEQCVADLDDAKSFVTANDAGASVLLADHGPAIAKAYDAARAAAAQAADADTCWNVLRTYLFAWRVGHLDVVRTLGTSVVGIKALPATPAADPRAPRLQVLGKNTLVLTLPTFAEGYGSVMQRFLAEQHAVLAAHRNWIVDVRNNDGGSDSTYHPLLAWLLDGELRGNTIEWFATPANAQAQEDVCALVSDQAACRQMMAPKAAAIRAAQPGSFVNIGSQPVVVEHIKLEPKRPARVAVLIDQPCGSSCEQFVLEARTGSRVKVLGRPTFGVLDYSNLRPHTLPSGRLLFYATTRSTRLPAMRIDGVGVAPDILLPKPQDEAGRAAEVKRVQRWLEGGSLGDK